MAPPSNDQGKESDFLPEACRSCVHVPWREEHPPSSSPTHNAAYWNYQFRHASQRINALKEKIVEQDAEIRRLKQDLYGKKSEKSKGSAESVNITSSGESSAPNPRGQQRGKKSRGRTMHSTLPGEVEIIDLPADDLTCRSCFKPYGSFPTPETSEIIEVEVSGYRRILHRNRYRQSCSCPDQKGLISAPVPPRLIPKSKIGDSLWILFLVEKFFSHQPTARTLKTLCQIGINLSCGTVTDGLSRIAPFFVSLYDAIVIKSRQASFFQGDETRYPVFELSQDKANFNWWLWIFLTKETVVYFLDPTRSAKVPLTHFDGLSGILLVDRYVAYKAMAKKEEGMRLAFCWAHVRRDFVTALTKHPTMLEWAHGWIREIGTIYHLTARRKSDHAAHEVILQTLDRMKTRAETEASDGILPIACRKAVFSLLHHWEGLTVFVDHPGVPLDNNASERELRGAVVGRKNFSGAGSQWSGQMAAHLYSIFGTWHLHGINIRTALTDYLSACAQNRKAPSDLSPWLPWKMEEEQRGTLSRPIGVNTG